MANQHTTLDFATAARQLGREARRRGLVAPSFRCPPRIVGVDRSLRRHPKGAVVAVQLKGRPWLAVLGDMIEGVVVANRLQPPHADRLRTELWTALTGESVLAPPTRPATRPATRTATRPATQPAVSPMERRVA